MGGGIGVPLKCSLGAAPCYLLFVLTRAILMPFIVSQAGFPLMLFGVSVFQEFPSALFLYWLPSNCAALLQALMLNRIPAIQSMVGIPKRILHDIKSPNPFDNIKKNFEKAQEEANQQNATKKANNAAQKANQSTHSATPADNSEAAPMSGKDRRMARRRHARRRRNSKQ